MTAYRAVVKYALDADPAIKKRELLEGLGFIAMELVAEHGMAPDEIEVALEDAHSDASLEYEMKQQREATDHAR